MLNKFQKYFYKLSKFISCTKKVKIQLTKSLLRPLLEYPSYPLAITSHSQKLKIQKTLNKAMRIAGNHRLRDKTKLEVIIQNTKMKPQNIRINHIAKKIIEKMKKIYIKKDKEYEIKYKLDPYFTFTNPPIKNKKLPIVKRIQYNIYDIYGKKSLLFRNIDKELQDVPLLRPNKKQIPPNRIDHQTVNQIESSVNS